MARRRPSIRRFNFQVANIKLLSNNRSGDIAYADIISKIKSRKISIPVRGDTHMIFRTQFADRIRIEGRDVEIMYGKISTYTVIDGNDWINLNNMEVETVDLPANSFPNLKETDYIFIPSAHRLAIVDNRTFSINTAKKFLIGAVGAVIERDEQFEVNIEQSEDIFERIVNAESVKKLLIDISYSNADTGDDTYEFMDTLIRDSEMKRLKMEATPNHTGNINANSRLVSGALKVAQSNGYAKATITEAGKKIKIDTNEHPRIIQVQCEESNLFANITNRVIDIFRRNRDAN